MNSQSPLSTSHNPLWRNISFTLMWTSTAASGFGDRMMMLAALALMGGLAAGSESTSINAAVTFWFTLPYVLISVFAGWLADHLPRKWLLLFCDESRGLLLLLGFYMVMNATGPADIPASHHWKIIAILIGVGTMAGIFNPTRNAIIPQLVPKKQLQAGNAIILGINVIASMIGLLVGPEIISPEAAASVRNGLFIASLFYLISGSFFAFLKIRQLTHVDIPVQPRSYYQAIIYISRHHRIITLILIDILVWTLASVVYCSILGIGKINFQLDSDDLLSFFGRMGACIGFGMLFGAISVAWINLRRESPIIMFTGLIVAGISVLVMTLVPLWQIACFAAFCVGMFGNMAIISIMTLMQSFSPNYIRGRIMGFNSMLTTICQVLAYLAIWLLPDADTNIVYVLYVLGPFIAFTGLFGLAGYITSGPMENGMTNALWRTTRLFVLVWHRLEWTGRENVPKSGPVILASNHTTGLDPFLIQAGCRRCIRWLMLTSYQFSIVWFIWKAVKPIALEQDGSDFAKLKMIVKVLKQGEIVGIFPEGGLQRTERELKPLQPGIAMMAIRSNATIVPVWLHGTPRKHSMLLHFLCPSHSRIRYGKPFKPDPSQSHEEIMTELRKRMLELSCTYGDNCHDDITS